ncbi:olpB [Scenedesmus sp. PABB004]|nr:olpB [Scenedesmus sp. PABB004]
MSSQWSLCVVALLLATAAVAAPDSPTPAPDAAAAADSPSPAPDAAAAPDSTSPEPDAAAAADSPSPAPDAATAPDSPSPEPDAAAAQDSPSPAPDAAAAPDSPSPAPDAAAAADSPSPAPDAAAAPDSTSPEPDAAAAADSPSPAPDAATAPDSPSPEPDAAAAQDSPSPAPDAAAAPDSPSPAPDAAAAADSPSPAPDAATAPDSTSPAPDAAAAPDSSSPELDAATAPDSPSPAPDAATAPDSPSPAPDAAAAPDSPSPAPDAAAAPDSPSPAPDAAAAADSPSPAPDAATAPDSPSPAPDVAAAPDSPSPAPDVAAAADSPSPAPDAAAAPDSPSPAPDAATAPDSPSPEPDAAAAQDSPSPAPDVAAAADSPSPAPDVAAAADSPSPAPDAAAAPDSTSPAPDAAAAPDSSSPELDAATAPDSPSPAPDAATAPDSPSPEPDAAAAQDSPSPAPDAAAAPDSPSPAPDAAAAADSPSPAPDAATAPDSPSPAPDVAAAADSPSPAPDAAAAPDSPSPAPDAAAAPDSTSPEPDAAAAADSPSPAPDAATAPDSPSPEPDAAAAQDSPSPAPDAAAAPDSPSPAPDAAAAADSPSPAPDAATAPDSPSPAPDVAAAPDSPSPAPDVAAAADSPSPAPDAAAAPDSPSPAPDAATAPDSPSPEPDAAAAQDSPSPAPDVAAAADSPSPAPDVAAAADSPSPAPDAAAAPDSTSPAPDAAAAPDSSSPELDAATAPDSPSPAPDAATAPDSPSPEPDAAAAQDSPSPAPDAAAAPDSPSPAPDAAAAADSPSPAPDAATAPDSPSPAPDVAAAADSPSPAPDAAAAPDSPSPAPDAAAAPDSTSPEPDAAAAADSPSPAPDAATAPDSPSPEPDAAAAQDSPSPAPDAAAAPDSPSPAPDAAAAADSPSPAPDAATAPDSTSPAPDAASAPDSSSPELDAATAPDSPSPAPDAATAPDSPSPEPDAAAAQDSPSPAPDAAAAPDSPSPAPDAAAAADSPSPAPDAATAPDSPSPAPDVAAAPDSPSPAPDVAAAADSPSPAPDAAAAPDSPSPAPDAATAPDSPSPEPDAAAAQDSPSPAPDAAAAPDSPSPAPDAAAAADSPSPAPDAAAAADSPSPAPDAATAPDSPSPEPDAAAAQDSPSPAPDAAAAADSPSPAPDAAAAPDSPSPEPDAAAEASPSPKPTAAAEASPSPEPTVAAEASPSPQPAAAAEASPSPQPAVAAEASPSPQPAAAAEASPSPEPTVAAEASPSPQPAAAAEASPSPEPTAAAEASPLPQPAAAAEASPSPQPAAAAEASPSPEPTVAADASPSPKPIAAAADASPSPASGTSPAATSSPSPGPAYDGFNATMGGGIVLPPSAVASQQLNNHSYLLYDVAASHSQAVQLCAALGAALPSVHSAAESQLLVQLCALASGGPAGCWIDRAVPGINGSMAWADGSDADFIAWATGAPPPDGDCAAVSRDGTAAAAWIGADCGAVRLPVLCKQDALGAGTVQWNASAHSAASAVLLNDQAFLLFVGAAAFDEARAQCGAMGGQLASARSALEGELLLELCARGGAGARCWIGLAAGAAGTFAWTNGSALDFTAWLPGRPANASEARCGFVAAESTSSGAAAWDNAMCTSVLPSFVCQLSTQVAPPSLYVDPPSLAPSLAVELGGCGTSSTFTAAGMLVSCLVVVRNAGNVGLVALAVSGAAANCSGLSDLELAPGQSSGIDSCSVSVVAGPAAIEAGNITLAVNVTATPARMTPFASVSGSASAVVPLTAVRALSVGLVRVAASDANATAGAVSEAGAVVRLRVTAINAGNIELRNVSVAVPGLSGRDGACTLKGAAASVALPLGVLPVGSELACEGSFTFTQALLEAGDRTFAAGASAANLGSDGSAALVEAPASVRVAVSASPHLAVDVDGPSCTRPARMPGAVTCPVLLTNPGNVGLNNVTLTTAGGATNDCTVAVLEPRGSALCSVVLQLSQADFDLGAVLLNATAGSASPRGPVRDLPPVSPDWAVVQLNQSAALDLSAGVSESYAPSAASTVAATFTAVNTGSVTLRNVSLIVSGNATLTGLACSGPANGTAAGVVVADGGVSIGALGVDASVTCTAAVGFADQAAFEAGRASLSVSGSGTAGNLSASDASQLVVVDAQLVASVSLSVAEANCSLPAAGGGKLTCPVVVVNTGSVRLDRAVLASASGAILAAPGCAALAATLAPGDRAVCMLEQVVPQAAFDAADANSSSGVEVLASVSMAPRGALSASAAAPAASASAQLSLAGVLTRVLAASNATMSPSEVSAAGTVVDYELQLQNAGNVALRGVAVASPTGLAAVQCGALVPPFSLAPGARAVCRASYRVTHADLATAGGASTKVHTLVASAERGVLVARDAGVALTYSCDTCAACVSEFGETCKRSLALAGAAADVGAALGAACADSGRSPAACAALRGAAAASRSGWLGLRAGRVCAALGECALGGANASRAGSCAAPAARGVSLAGTAIAGAVDLCSVQGVVGGDLLPGFSATRAPSRGLCFNSSDCGSDDLLCATGQAAVQSVCTCEAGADSCTPAYDCKPTPCKVCRSCLAEWTAAMAAQRGAGATAGADTVALVFGSKCLASGRSSALCKEVQARVANRSTVALRAGLLCSTLGECPLAGLPVGCSLASAGADNASALVPAGELSLCTADGTTGGSPLPAILPPAPAATMLCASTADCNSTDLTCSMAGAARVRCICDPTDGSEACTRLGECMSSMAGFAAQQANVSNSSLAAEAFERACAAGGIRAAALCAQVATAVRASRAGNAAKRPAALCRQLGECGAGGGANDSCTIDLGGATTPLAQLSLCSPSGAPGGLVPGVSASAELPAGRCRTSADCAGEFRCSMASPAPLCTCADGVDTCFEHGKCAPTACGTCASCVAAVGPFVAAQGAAATPSAVGDAWRAWAFCTNVLRRNASRCAETAAAVVASYGGNLGRRAGALCSALGDCVSDMANCSISTRLIATNATATGAVSLCSQEGIAAGAALPGVAGSDGRARLLAAGGCQVSADCNATHLMCSVAAGPRQLCTCSPFTGLDECSAWGSCVRTPCKVCQDCLDGVRPFISRSLFETDAVKVAASFGAYCRAAGLAANASCDAVASSIAASGNTGKRAGKLCQGLGLCDAAAVGGGAAAPCSLAAPKLAEPARELTGSSLDLCSAEGLEQGTVLPGVAAPSSALPASTCDSNADCPAPGNECDRRSERPLCSCVGGADVCRSIGGCRETACFGCGRCLAAFQGFVASADAQEPDPGALGAKLYSYCTQIARRPARVCYAAQVAVAASARGNLGRRAAGICTALQDCDVAALGFSCRVEVPSSISNTTEVGGVDGCTRSGVSGGARLPGIGPDGAPPPLGACRPGLLACGSADEQCSMAAPTEVCTCAGGVDTCVSYGACVPTPCAACQACLAALQTHVGGVAAELPAATAAPADVAARAAAACAAASLATGEGCAKLASFVSGSYRGYPGRRAGTMCSVLGHCRPALLANCTLSLPGLASGALDQCTAEGVAGGAQLLDIATAAGMPAGRCTSREHCNATAECDMSTTTQLCRCSRGVDACQAVGSCRALPPPPPPERTPCERCGGCMAGARPAVAALAGNATGKEVGQAVYGWCSATYSLTACRELQAAVAASYAGSLGRRPGALCARLKECAPALPGCGFSVDVCSTSGTRGNGTSVPGTFSGAALPVGACAADGDCTGGQRCSMAAQVKVCRCLDGTDVCDMAGTCRDLPAPPVMAPPLTPCEQCKRCVGLVAPLAAAAAAGNDSANALAASMEVACLANLTAKDVVGCAELRRAISRSFNGNAAKRAGLICSRLGRCPASLPATCQLSASANSSLSLCTVEGWAGGAAVPGTSAAANLTGLCRRDADCTGRAEVCSTATPVQSCACAAADGTDQCQQLGRCVDICSTPAAAEQLEAAARQVLSCDPFLPNTCAGGLVCQSSAQCLTLTCVPGVGVTTARCSGLCLPAVRLLAGARFSDASDAVLVDLNAPARAARFPCASAFDAAGPLGGGAWCEVSDAVLTVRLGPGASLLPGNTLSLKTSQRLLSDKLLDGAFFTGNATVAPCRACLPPLATVAGPKARAPRRRRRARPRAPRRAAPRPPTPAPRCRRRRRRASQVVSEPCDVASAADITFDATYSRDPSGRPLASLAWAQAGGALSPALGSLVDAANAAGAARLAIPPGTVLELPNGEYALSLTATSFLGRTATTTLAWTKRGAGEAPAVSILGGQAQDFRIADGLRVSSALLAKSVCAGQQVEYAWEAVAADGVPALQIPAKAAALKDLVLPPPVPAAPGRSYRVRLTARFQGAEASSSAEVELRAVGSPLAARLRGPAGDVKGDRAITLDASGSADPDDPAGNAPLQFAWTCTRDDWPAPCFANASHGDVSAGGARWQLPAALLEPDRRHTFSVTVTKAAPGDARSSSAELTITPRPAALPIPTGRVSRLCGGRAAGAGGAAAGGCAARHGADAPLSLLLRADPGFEAAAVTWHSEQVAALAGGAAGGAQLTLAPGDLPAAGSVTIVAALSLNGMAGSTSITVPLNQPPACGKAAPAPPGGGGPAPPPRCLELSATNGTFGSATFTASAGAFQDEGPLSFDFGLVEPGSLRKKSLFAGSSSSYVFAGLPQGRSTLYVCASDSDGAAACETADVDVLPPAADFAPSDALTQLDVARMASTNDVSVLAAGAAALQSLTAYVTAGAGGANGSGDAAAEPEAQARLVVAIEAKAGALINTLAGSADALVVGAAAALSAASGAVSADTATNLAAIAQAGVASARVSSKLLSADQAAQIIAVAAGVAKASGDGGGVSGGGGAKRLLLADAGPPAVRRPPAGWLGSVRAALGAPFAARRRLAEAGTPADGAGGEAARAVRSTMDALAELLSASATPATGALSTGASGLHLSVANLLGASFAQQPLAAGPVAGAGGGADAAAAGNAVLTMAQPLAGGCEVSDEEGGGGGAAAGCADGTVSLVLKFYADPALLVDPALAAPAPAANTSASNTTTERGTPLAMPSRTAGAGNGTDAGGTVPLPDLELASSAVVVSVAGAPTEGGAFPCANASSGCGAVLQLPLTRAPPGDGAGAALVGLRVEDATGAPLAPSLTDPDAELLNVTSPANGTAAVATLFLRRSGTFVVGLISRTAEPPVNGTGASNCTLPSPSPAPAGGASPSPAPPPAGAGASPSPAPPPPAPSSPAPAPPAQGVGDATPAAVLGINITFPMDHAALVADGARRAAFEADVASAVAAALGVGPGVVHVTALRAGSVIADVEVRVQPSLGAGQLAALTALVEAFVADPAPPLAAVRAAYFAGAAGGITAAVWAPPPPRDPLAELTDRVGRLVSVSTGALAGGVAAAGVAVIALGALAVVLLRRRAARGAARASFDDAAAIAPPAAEPPAPSGIFGAAEGGKGARFALAADEPPAADPTPVAQVLLAPAALPVSPSPAGGGSPRKAPRLA